MSHEPQELKAKVVKDAAYYREYRARRKAAAQPEKLEAAPVAEPVVLDPEQVAEVAEVAQPPSPPPHDAIIDITRPPRRLPIRSKGQWQVLPDWAREDIIRREQEFDTAFKKYEGLGVYAIKAQENGTTLLAFVEACYNLENELRKEPLEGTTQLWQRMGVDCQSTAAKMVEKHLPEYPKQVYAAGFEQGRIAGQIETFGADSLISKA